MQQDKKQSGTNYRAQLSDSQNFITSQKLIRRIIDLSNISKKDTVIEIGTGKGHLTEALCQRGGSVCSVELDRKLYEKAKVKLSPFSNLRLIQGDFLKYTLPARGNYKVFANIPYFITTQIIDKLTNAPNPATDIWLIMEKGAAKRFTGAAKETERSLLLKVNWNMKILYHFRKEDFHPMPSVDSVLVYFSRKATADLSKSECAAFQKFIAHSRKYGFGRKGSLLTRRQAQTALKQAGLPHAHEDGVTLYIQWLCLFRCYQRIYGRKRI
ncbi:MAG: 23S ribosomal RNA methyltransferase Erm [Acetatifactor sp.]|nr:23S ribosomal RNA methyltransferase Erm [Acetatifactor sp.]